MEVCMYKFFGTPLKAIMSKTSHKVMFTFDTKGEFITDDIKIIDRAKGYFDCVELEVIEVGEKVKKTFEEPKLTITRKDDEKDPDKEIRQLAKDKKIASWHLKSIETLKEELGA